MANPGRGAAGPPTAVAFEQRRLQQYGDLATASQRWDAAAHLAGTHMLLRLPLCMSCCTAHLRPMCLSTILMRLCTRRTSRSGAMQLIDSDIKLMETTLQSVVGATQLQQLQIVTSSYQDRNIVTIAHLVWQAPESTSALCCRARACDSCKPTMSSCCAGLCMLFTTLPHSSGRLLHRHATWQSEPGASICQPARTRVRPLALPPDTTPVFRRPMARRFSH